MDTRQLYELTIVSNGDHCYLTRRPAPLQSLSQPFALPRKPALMSVVSTTDVYFVLVKSHLDFEIRFPNGLHRLEATQ